MRSEKYKWRWGWGLRTDWQPHSCDPISSPKPFLRGDTRVSFQKPQGRKRRHLIVTLGYEEWRGHSEGVCAANSEGVHLTLLAMTRTELCGSTNVPWRQLAHHFVHVYLGVKHISGHVINSEGKEMVSHFLLAHITEPIQKQKEGCL